MSEPPALTPEQKSVLEEASARMKTVLRPARVARVNGWTVGVFGVLSVLLGLVSGGGGVVVGLALVAVAWNEMRGIKRLQALDPEGARILAWNQLILGGVVAVYCAAAIARARVSPDPSMKELEELGGIPAGLIAELTTVLYGAVAAIVVIVQALFARYHFKAGEKVAAFRRDTPAWVVELLRATAP